MGSSKTKCQHGVRSCLLPFDGQKARPDPVFAGTAPGNEGRGAPGNGHGSDKTPTTPETGNGNSGNVVKGNNDQDKAHSNNGLHLGQLKNGKENPGQGRDRRSDTGNLHAQDV